MKKGPPSSAFLRTKCALNYDVLIVPRDSLNDIALEHLEGILLLRKSLIYPLEHKTGFVNCLVDEILFIRARLSPFHVLD